jgi:hypothetical protein
VLADTKITPVTNRLGGPKPACRPSPAAAL